MPKTIGNERGNLSFMGWAIIVIIFLITIFVLQNTEVVDITFLFWQMSLSRVLLLLGAIAVGVIIGLLIGWDLFRSKKKKGSKEKIEPVSGPPGPSVSE